MTLTKRTRDKPSNGDQDCPTSSDGGDLLAPIIVSSLSAVPSPQARKSIRDKLDTTFYENSYLLYKGKKPNSFMISISKALTWFTKISIYYHLESLGKYHIRRIIAYLFVVLIAGIINDYLLTSPSPLPNSVLDFIDTNLKTSKRHFLNVYFVKWGWLWTYIALIPFFIFSRIYFVKQKIEKIQKSFSKAPKRKKSVHFKEPLEDQSGDLTISNANDSTDQGEIKESDMIEPFPNSIKYFLIQFGLLIIPTFVRLAISTAIWYFSVKIFVNIHHSEAACHFPSNSTIVDSVTQKECIEQGFHWRPIGFDISGHIFLMIFSNLIRIDELTFLVKKFDEFAEFRYLGLSLNDRLKFTAPYRFKFSIFHFLTTLLIALTLMLTLIWDFMIIQTAFFYHTWTQKIAGLGWAIIAWAMTYQAMFQHPMLHLQVAP